jgi:hypothetical protein
LAGWGDSESASQRANPCRAHHHAEPCWADLQNVSGINSQKDLLGHRKDGRHSCERIRLKSSRLPFRYANPSSAPPMALFCRQRSTLPTVTGSIIKRAMAMRKEVARTKMGGGKSYGGDDKGCTL